MKELDDLESLKGRDLSMGGIVVGCREGITKTNKSFAVIKVEDYSGIGEFFLMGNDYVNFHKFGVPNLYIYIRGRVEPRFRDSDALTVKIGTIELLPDVNDRIIESLTVVLPSESVDRAMVDVLQENLPNSSEVRPNSISNSSTNRSRPTHQTLCPPHKDRRRGRSHPVPHKQQHRLQDKRHTIRS